MVTVLREIQQIIMQVLTLCRFTVSVPCSVKTAQIYEKRPFALQIDLFYSCAHLGSNQGPKDYESSTLTNWAIGAAFRLAILQKCFENY